jgi:hypothetical protein
MHSIMGRGERARSHAPVVRERGRGTRPLSFFFLALTLALAGVISSPAFTIVDAPEVFSPVSAPQGEGGVGGDSSVGSTKGHSAPLEDATLHSSACRTEAGAAQGCNN